MSLTPLEREMLTALQRIERCVRGYVEKERKACGLDNIHALIFQAERKETE